MKTILTIMTLLTLNQLAEAQETASYHVLKGPLHKGGVARVEIMEKSKKSFVAKMTYEIHKRMLVPVSKNALKGETIFTLPAEFSSKRGYMKLEKKGTIEIEKAWLQFIRKSSWRGKSDAYDVRILPKNGKSQIEVTYHPSIPAAGWGRVVIQFISPYPILNGYNAIIELD